MIRQALAAGAVALALAGCGPSAPSMSRMRAQAARVCTRALARTSRIPPPNTPAQTGTFLRSGISALRMELAQLRKLRAPTDQASAYATALGAEGRELTILAATLHDLDRGADPLSAINTLARALTPVEAKEDAAWRTLEVPACLTR